MQLLPNTTFYPEGETKKKIFFLFAKGSDLNMNRKQAGKYFWETADLKYCKLYRAMQSWF